MEREAGVTRAPVPTDSGENEPQTFVFVSTDFETNTEKLLVIIQGSEAKRGSGRAVAGVQCLSFWFIC